MHSKGTNDLEALLKGLLDEEGPSELDERLRWLCDHLAEYLERWLGFAKMEDLSVEATLKNKVFLAVLAGINVTNEYVEKAKAERWCPLREWSDFKNAVEWVRRRPERDELDLVECTFETFSKRLSERSKMTGR
jgi:hypothetical protein